MILRSTKHDDLESLHAGIVDLSASRDFGVLL
jgi:hypothetical protein